MEQICLQAMAKINLGLDVIRRKENGYHEVRMIMQNVKLYDELSIVKEAQQEIRISVDKKEIPGNQNNLIYKAAKLFMEAYHIKEGVTITLKKKIPIAAGMAGGSTDAAATLIGMNKLFEVNVSNEELMKLGVTIGADIPYCIMGGTALAEGIGEVLTKLPDIPDCYLLIAKPDIYVSTKFVYENLHADTLEKHPDIDGMKQAIEQKDINGVAALLENVLETVTVKEYPIIEEIKQFMKERGALNALMSGSGPTVFGLYESEQAAQSAYEQLKEKNLAKQLFVTTFCHEGIIIA